MKQLSFFTAVCALLMTSIVWSAPKPFTFNMPGVASRIVYSPNGKHIACGLQGKVYVWRGKDDEAQTLKLQQSAYVQDLAYTNTVIAAQTEKGFAVWDANKYEVLFEQNGDFNAMAVSSNSEVLAVANGRLINLYSIPSGKIIRTLSGHQYDVTELTFNSDSAELISLAAIKQGPDNGEVKNWDVSTGKISAQRRVSFVDPTNSLFIQHGESLLSRNPRKRSVIGNWMYLPPGRPEILNVSYGTWTSLEESGEGTRWDSLIVSPKETLIAAIVLTGPNAQPRGGVAVWDADNGFNKIRYMGMEEQPPRTLWQGFYPTSIAFSPDDSLLAIARQDNLVKIYPLPDKPAWEAKRDLDDTSLETTNLE